jgi:hypothetical protein
MNVTLAGSSFLLTKWKQMIGCSTHR